MLTNSPSASTRPAPVTVSTRLTVVDSDGSARQLAEPFDSVIAADGAFEPLAVIEDEILAALPMAPLHGADTECGQQREPSRDTQFGAGQTHRPFESLATLVGNENDRERD